MQKPSILRRTILILSLFLLSAPMLLSQKVGLVLSGGGAKGIAHIGVIKALEDNNIPIDYVAGTSIGAIVGGLYACGLSPAEMETIFRDPRFISYYKGNILDEHVYFFKKTHPDASFFNISLENKNNKLAFVLPTNLVSTVAIDFGFMEHFIRHSVAAHHDFDSLFVPFRCVASDIYNDKEHVFKSGNLGDAIRASMSFPFYYKPIEIDDTLYIDGGLYNNFPVDVMQQVFDPQYIIGVSVSGNIEKPNPDDLMLQVENLIFEKEKSDILKNTEGIILKVDTKSIKLFDFDRYDEIFAAGYDVCMKNIDSIKKIIPVRSDPDTLKMRRAAYAKTLPTLQFDNIAVTGTNPTEDFYFNNIIKKHKAKLLNISQLEQKYYRLATDYHVQTVKPNVFYNDSLDAFDVQFAVHKRHRMNLSFGACISSGYGNQAFIGANYKIVKYLSFLFDANLYFGRMYTAGHLSTRLDFPVSFPLAAVVSADFNKFDYYKSSSDMLQIKGKPPYINIGNRTLRADLFTARGNNAVLKIGFAGGKQTYDYFQVKNFQLSDTSDITTFAFNTLHISLISNTLNLKQYPNKGHENYITLRYVGGTETNIPGSTTVLTDVSSKKAAWLQCRLHSDIYTRLSPFMTLGIFGELTISNKPLFRNYYSSLLSAPAFAPMVHTQTVFLPDFRANSYVAAGLKPIFHFTDRLDLRIEAYLFAPYEKILRAEPADEVYKPYCSEKFAYLHTLGSAIFVYNTRIGPIALGLNCYKSGDNIKKYITFHFGYILFNKDAFEP